MHIATGTDTYGRVKTVGGTPIVTRFAMLQAMPIYPLQSFYYARAGRTETLGIPLLASYQAVKVHGIPLARVDRLSVAMAYTRGILGAMTVIGFLAVIPILMRLTGARLDAFAMTAMRVLIACFTIGAVGGLLTYTIPLASKRERRIRRCCGELLGICADPARVTLAASVAIEAQAALAASPGDLDSPRCALLQQLVTVRSRVARSVDLDLMEQETDRLLDQLDQPGIYAEQPVAAPEPRYRSSEEAD